MLTFSTALRRFDLRVFLEDTDAFGVVYHANYLKFLERGRTDWFNQQGFQLAKFMNQDIIFSVSRCTVQFHRPAKLEDNLVVQTQLVRHKLYLFRFNQTITNQLEQTLITAEIDVISLDKRQERPKSINFSSVI